MSRMLWPGAITACELEKSDKVKSVFYKWQISRVLKGLHNLNNIQHATSSTLQTLIQTENSGKTRLLSTSAAWTETDEDDIVHTDRTNKHTCRVRQSHTHTHTHAHARTHTHFTLIRAVFYLHLNIYSFIFSSNFQLEEKHILINSSDVWNTTDVTQVLLDSFFWDLSCWVWAVSLCYSRSATSHHSA